MNKILIAIIALTISCSNKKSRNDFGLVKKLPPGVYTIDNYGSRHIVRCINQKGECYFLNDANFDINNIPGHDAHQYQDPTKITIK